MNLAWLCILACIMTWMLTGLLRRYAVAKNLIDIPNVRSSHHVATPRGGGVAIVVVFLLALFFLYRIDLLSMPVLLAFAGAGTLVAITGFLDDHRHIPARWRLLAHFCGAAWGLYWLGGFPPMQVFGAVVSLGWLGHGLCLVYLVWLLNLYNFMDGIDGIASIEAISVCLGGALLLIVPEYDFKAAVWPLLLLSAGVTGFLSWNFPPAKIFMGDAGSGFLGIMLGLFSIQAAWIAPQFFWSWLILLGVFIVDATLTLCRRFFQHEKVYEAHCSHAYQHAARFYQAHKPVSLAVAGINLCWLLPVALGVGFGDLNGFWGLTIAYFPLVLLAAHFRAGIRNSQS